MSMQALNWARAQTPPPVIVGNEKKRTVSSRVQKAVLKTLADHANADGVSWYSVKTMCDETGYSRASFFDALQALEGQGYIDRVPRPNTSSVYRVILDRVAQADTTAEVRESVLPAVEPVPKTVLPDVATTPENGVPPKTVDVQKLDPPVQKLDPPRPETGPTPVQKLDTESSCESTSNPHGSVSAAKTDHAAKTDQSAKAARSKRKTPLPDDFTISADIQAWATEHGFTHLEDHLEALTGWAKAKGAWCPDWDEMLKRAIRENWGLVSEEPKTGNIIDLEEYARRSREEGARFLEQREAEIQASRLAKLMGTQAASASR